jgi:hypothetical protein
VADLARACLLPRTVLCSACLTAVVLQGTLDQLQAAGAAQGFDMGLTPGVDLPPQAALRRMSDLLAWGAVTGLALSCALAERDVRQEPGSHFVSVTPEEVTLAARGVLDDALGDGEVCWERLLQAAAELLPALPQLRAALRRPRASLGLRDEESQAAPERKPVAGSPGGPIVVDCPGNEEDGDMPVLEPLQAAESNGLGHSGSRAGEEGPGQGPWWVELQQLAEQPSEMASEMVEADMEHGRSGEEEALRRLVLTDVVLQSVGLRLLLRAL